MCVKKLKDYWENGLDVIEEEEATCGEGKFILFIIYLR